MTPRETKNNAYAKFGVTNKEHYGMLWYFLEWSVLQNKLNVFTCCPFFRTFKLVNTCKGFLSKFFHYTRVYT